MLLIIHTVFTPGQQLLQRRRQNMSELVVGPQVVVHIRKLWIGIRIAITQHKIESGYLVSLVVHHSHNPLLKGFNCDWCCHSLHAL